MSRSRMWKLTGFISIILSSMLPGGHLFLEAVVARIADNASVDNVARDGHHVRDLIPRPVGIAAKRTAAVVTCTLCRRFPPQMCKA